MHATLVTTFVPFFANSSGDVNKAKYAERKKQLQEAFQERLGLRVYIPLPHGGNSNSGNVARKAFENIEVFAEITSFPLDLLKDLYDLAMALSCTQKISPKLYEAKATDWLNRFHSNPDINWHWFSPTVHILLEHGHQIIAILPVAVGLGSEEAIEHGNKVSIYIQCFNSSFS